MHPKVVIDDCLAVRPHLAGADRVIYPGAEPLACRSAMPLSHVNRLNLYDRDLAEFTDHVLADRGLVTKTRRRAQIRPGCLPVVDPICDSLFDREGGRRIFRAPSLRSCLKPGLHTSWVPRLDQCIASVPNPIWWPPDLRVIGPLAPQGASL